MDQNLSLYRIFYAVATAGNISKAGEELYISQPAISKSIKKLEQKLNTTLFLRNSKGVELTEEGKILFEYVKSAFHSLSIGEEQIKQITELGIGHLKIGVSTTLCKNILLPYLKRFIEYHPHIKISIECQSTNYTLAMLSDNRIDIGLIGKPSSNQGIHFYPLGEIEDIFAATETYINNLAFRTSASDTNIFNQATLMLLDKENLTRQYIEEYLKKNKIELNHAIEITSMDLLIEFAKIGLGAACIIKEFVTTELQTGVLKELPLPYPIPKRTIGFAHKNNSTLSNTVQEFINFLHQEKLFIP
jgi:DNA-binding transcriptional LysR family regulator